MWSGYAANKNGNIFGALVWYILLTVVAICVHKEGFKTVFDSDQDVDLAAELESAEAFERQGDDKTHGKGDEKAEIKNK